MNSEANWMKTYPFEGCDTIDLKMNTLHWLKDVGS